MSTPVKPLRVGDILYGYCGGEFGRDSYGEKRVEAIGGDWVVAREGDEPVFFQGNPEALLEYTATPDEWEEEDG